MQFIQLTFFHSFHKIMSCMNVFWCVFSLPPLQQQIITKAQNDHDHPNPEKKKILENLEQKYPTESNQKCIALSITIFIPTYSPFSAYLPKNTNLSWMQCITTTSITTKKGGGRLRIWVVLRKKNPCRHPGARNIDKSLLLPAPPPPKLLYL